MSSNNDVIKVLNILSQRNRLFPRKISLCNASLLCVVIEIPKSCEISCFF